MSKNNKHKFTTSEEVMIVDFYRGHEHLWNTKDKDYPNKHLRKAKMMQLSEQLNVPEDQIKSKWHNIRIQFTKNDKLHKGKSDASAENVSVNWIHYKSMEFVPKGQESVPSASFLDHLFNKNRVSNESMADEEEDDLQENVSIVDSYSALNEIVDIDNGSLFEKPKESAEQKKKSKITRKRK